MSSDFEIAEIDEGGWEPTIQVTERPSVIDIIGPAESARIEIDYTEGSE